MNLLSKYCLTQGTMKSLTTVLLTIFVFSSVSFCQNNVLIIDFNIGFSSDQSTNGSRIYNRLIASQASVARVNTMPLVIDTALYNQVWVLGDMGLPVAANLDPIVNYMNAGGAVYVQSEIMCCDNQAAYIDSLINVTCTAGVSIDHINNTFGFFEYEPVPNPLCSAWVGHGNASRVFEGVPAANVFFAATGNCGGNFIAGEVIGVRFGPIDMYTGNGALICVGDFNIFPTAASCTVTGLMDTENDKVLIDFIANSFVALLTSAGPVEAGNDVTICNGDSTILTASGAGGTYQWSTGDTTASITVSPSVNTTYFVTADTVCPTTDSVVVSVTDLTVDAGPNDTICNGDATVLTASGGGAYQWSTGDTTASITVSPSADTTYYVTATDSFCSRTDSVQVSVGQPPLAVTITGPNQLCMDSSITLTVQGPGPYTWSTGDTLDSITVSPAASTSYWVQSTNSCGTSSDTVNITVTPPPVLQVSNDTTISIGETVTLIASGANSYLWSTGTALNNINVSPDQTATYTVTGTDSFGCSAEDSVTVTITIPAATLPFVYLPNVFSTASDNPDNARLYVFGQGIKSLELTIYDRWGEQVYLTADVSENMRSDGECCAYGGGWDGTYNNTGRPLNGSVFVFMLKGEFEDGGEFNESGNITLIQ